MPEDATDETSLERLVSAARQEAAEATAEIGDLSGRLEDCESQLQFVHDAFDTLMEVTDEFVVFIAADGNVEGVSEKVSELAAVGAEALSGRPFVELARQLRIEELTPLVRRAIRGAPVDGLDLGEWRFGVRPLEGDEPGAVVVGRRIET